MGTKLKSTPAALVIDQLGGSAKVARYLAIQTAVVTNWRRRGFPPHRYVELSELLKRRRIAFHPSLFGQNPGRGTD